MTEPIRVVVAEDDTIVRAGVCLLLNTERDIDVVGEAANGQEAIESAESLRPDVLLMDISMPVLNGLEATQIIKDRFPEIEVLALTMHRSDEYFFAMLKAGAAGYVTKGAPTEELIEAIRTVARGEIYLRNDLIQRLLRDYLAHVQDQPPDPAGPELTPREAEIVRWLVDGYSTKEIAEELEVSPSTVHSHRNNLMNKLGLSSRRELVVYARKNGLIGAS